MPRLLTQLDALRVADQLRFTRPVMLYQMQEPSELDRMERSTLVTYCLCHPFDDGDYRVGVSYVKALLSWMESYPNKLVGFSIYKYEEGAITDTSIGSPSEV
jgi:hypothetical protein